MAARSLLSSIWMRAAVLCGVALSACGVAEGGAAPAGGDAGVLAHGDCCSLHDASRTEASRADSTDDASVADGLDDTTPSQVAPDGAGFVMPDCGAALPGFAGSLCGPVDRPCQVLLDESVPSADPYSGSPVLAVDSSNRPHVLFGLQVNSASTAAYASRTDALGWTTETFPGKFAIGGLTLQGDDTAWALVHDGAIPGTALWRHGLAGWQNVVAVDGFEAISSALYSASIVASAGGCLHAGLVDEAQSEAPTYGVYNGTWSMLSLASASMGLLPPVVGLALDGTPELAYQRALPGGLGVGLYWRTPTASAELVEPLQTTSNFYAHISTQIVPHVAEGAGAGADLLYRVGQDERSGDVHYATRVSAGSWSARVVVPMTGTTLTNCGNAARTSGNCSIDYQYATPLAAVASTSGDFRFVLVIAHVTATLVPTCQVAAGGPAGGTCTWMTTNLATASRITLGWPQGNTWMTADVLPARVDPSRAQTVTGEGRLDRQGRIHLALLDPTATNQLRYVVLGP